MYIATALIFLLLQILMSVRYLIMVDVPMNASIWQALIVVSVPLGTIFNLMDMTVVSNYIFQCKHCNNSYIDCVVANSPCSSFIEYVHSFDGTFLLSGPTYKSLQTTYINICTCVARLLLDFYAAIPLSISSLSEMSSGKVT